MNFLRNLIGFLFFVAICLATFGAIAFGAIFVAIGFYTGNYWMVAFGVVGAATGIGIVAWMKNQGDELESSGRLR